MGHMSFISEHSAEYVLVKDIVKTLSQDFGHVIPLYFWATREGANIARQCMNDRKVCLLAIYARRPKIMQPDQNWLLMKINYHLIEAARIGANVGCPVLAGIPLITNLSDFTLDVPCSWFRLKGGKSTSSDYEIRLSLKGKLESPDDSLPFEGPLSKSALIKLIHEDTQLVPWDYAAEIMKMIRGAGLSGMRGFFMPGYRPFFIVIPASINQ